MRGVMIETLRKRFGETQTAIGLAGPKAAVEVWRSVKTGSWTILLTRPDKLSCVIASGRDWEMTADVPTGPEQAL